MQLQCEKRNAVSWVDDQNLRIDTAGSVSPLGRSFDALLEALGVKVWKSSTFAACSLLSSSVSGIQPLKAGTATDDGLVAGMLI